MHSPAPSTGNRRRSEAIMLEAYAFLAAFTVQILVTSILYPALFIRFVRARTMSLPAERLAQMYPGVDVARAQERFLTRYSALHTVIAVIGLLLLAWLFGYVRRADWHDTPVKVLITVYFFVAQVFPLGLIVWLGVRFNKEHKRSLPDRKRKAVLERRGLFDFISPFAVTLAVMGYFLFAVFMLYLRQRPFPGFAGVITLVGVTLVYAFIALVIYTMVYGKNRNPLDTHAGRLHSIGVAVKSGVYTCIVTVVYLSFNFGLRLLDLQRWELFALSMFFVICALLTSLGVIKPLRQPEAAAPGSRV
jgi:hypothetical protein